MKEFIVLVYFIILIHQTVIARVINTIEDDEDDIIETKKHHRSKRHIKQQNNLITEVENLYSVLMTENAVGFASLILQKTIQLTVISKTFLLHLKSIQQQSKIKKLQDIYVIASKMFFYLLIACQKRLPAI